LSDDDRWRRSEPPLRGPSAPPGERFDPFATALGVFFAVAIPFFVAGYSQSGVLSTVLIAGGIGLAICLAILAGAWLAGRDGDVQRRPPRR
jgi:hypothetical protein